MAKGLIDESILTDIANAIRAKDGSTAKMLPSAMAGKINAIETGGVPSPITAGNTPVYSVHARGYVTSSTYTATNLKYTVPKTGTYRFKYCMGTGGSSGSRGSQLRKNGTVVKENTSVSSNTQQNSVDITCNAGDEVVVWLMGGGTTANYSFCTGMSVCINWDNGF